MGKELQMQMWVWSLGWDDPLDKYMTTHSSMLPGKSHGQRSLAGYSPQGCKELDMTARMYADRLEVAISTKVSTETAILF